ncbi:MAG: phospho-sugar mutase, partial [Hymenobacter sp.]
RGAEEIKEMMAELRKNPPATLAGSPVVEVRDYDNGKITHLRTGKEESTGVESSNVLQFITEAGDKISARPSGTEPKIKFYFSVKEPLASVADFEPTQKRAHEKIQRIIDEMKLK